MAMDTLILIAKGGTEKGTQCFIFRAIEKKCSGIKFLSFDKVICIKDSL